jgi:hypothetical protein
MYQKNLHSFGVVDVVVNSLCPGLVNSEISRYIANQSWYARLLTPLYMTIGGKSPDMGARFYVKAAMRDEKDHVSPSPILALSIFIFHSAVAVL